MERDLVTEPEFELTNKHVLFIIRLLGGVYGPEFIAPVCPLVEKWRLVVRKREKTNKYKRTLGCEHTCAAKESTLINTAEVADSMIPLKKISGRIN